jgi:hypothetical protein
MNMRDQTSVEKYISVGPKIRSFDATCCPFSVLRNEHVHHMMSLFHIFVHAKCKNSCPALHNPPMLVMMNGTQTLELVRSLSGLCGGIVWPQHFWRLVDIVSDLEAPWCGAGRVISTDQYSRIHLRGRWFLHQAFSSKARLQPLNSRENRMLGSSNI